MNRDVEEKLKNLFEGVSSRQMPQFFAGKSTAGR